MISLQNITRLQIALSLVVAAIAVWMYYQRYYFLESITVYCDGEECPFLETALPPMHLDDVHVYESSADGKRYELRNLAKGGEPMQKFDCYIKYNSDTRFQTIFGFGGAFTDAAVDTIEAISTETRDNLLKSYFGPLGLEYNIGRIPIGSTDFSTRPYTYADAVKDDFDLKHFSLADFDIKVRIPHIRDATKLSKEPVFLFGSMGSLPKWLKPTSAVFSKSIKGKTGDVYRRTYATYLAKFLQAYAMHKVDVQAITLQTDPMFSYVPFVSSQALKMSANEQRDLIANDVGPTLRELGHGNVKVIILDEHRYFLKDWAETIYSDREASKYVLGAGVHSYYSKYFSYEPIKYVRTKYPQKLVLITKAVVDSLPWHQAVMLGNWDRAIQYAVDIIKTLQNGANGYVDWNLALDPKGGPSWTGLNLDAPIIVVNRYVFLRQPTYYAIAHFSKFLHKESKIVESTSSCKQLLTLAALRRDARRILIIINPGPRTFRMKLRDDSGRRTFYAEMKPYTFQSYIWRAI